MKFKIENSKSRIPTVSPTALGDGEVFFTFADDGVMLADIAARSAMRVGEGPGNGRCCLA